MRLIVFALCVVLVLGACASLNPQQPEIELEGVRPLNLSLSGQRLAVTLKLSNPNDFDLTLRNVDLTATLGGEAVATGTSDDAVTLPANGEQILELEVIAGLDVALATLRAALDSDQEGLDYGVNGTVRVAGWPVAIPFETDGRVDNPLVDGLQ